MKNDIIDKIKKLFALSSNNDNENESLMAMKAAKKLLDKHKLKMTDLSDKEKVGVKLCSEVNMPYVKIIYGSISRLYSCDYITDKTVKPCCHLIIGTESNFTTASIVIEFVLSKIRKESVGLGNSFRNSAALGIKDQVNAILLERSMMKEDAIPGTGLTLFDIDKLSKQENDKFINKQFNIKTKKSKFKGGNINGRKLGNSINLGAHLNNAQVSLN